MNINNFIEELKKINIEITEKQLKQLEKYYELLVQYNEKMNLTGITEKEQVYLKHFYDSLTINKIIELNEVNSLCDVGTGAGFPGLVIKIIFPNIDVTLVLNVSLAPSASSHIPTCSIFSSVFFINPSAPKYKSNYSNRHYTVFYCFY